MSHSAVISTGKKIEQKIREILKNFKKEVIIQIDLDFDCDLKRLKNYVRNLHSQNGYNIKSDQSELEDHGDIYIGGNYILVATFEQKRTSLHPQVSLRTFFIMQEIRGIRLKLRKSIALNPEFDFDYEYPGLTDEVDTMFVEKVFI